MQRTLDKDRTLDLYTILYYLTDIINGDSYFCSLVESSYCVLHQHISRLLRDAYYYVAMRKNCWLIRHPAQTIGILYEAISLWLDIVLLLYRKKSIISKQKHAEKVILQFILPKDGVVWWHLRGHVDRCGGCTTLSRSIRSLSKYLLYFDTIVYPSEHHKSTWPWHLSDTWSSLRGGSTPTPASGAHISPLLLAEMKETFRFSQ